MQEHCNRFFAKKIAYNAASAGRNDRQFPVFPRGHPGQLVEHPVKLREAAEAAGSGDVRYFIVCGQQLVLGILDPGDLDVVGQSELHRVLKAVRQIIRVDIEFIGKHLERELFTIMLVDIRCYGVHLLGDGRKDSIILILVLIPQKIDFMEELDELRMDHEFVDGTVRILWSTGILHNIVELLKENQSLFRRKTVNVFLGMKCG